MQQLFDLLGPAPVIFLLGLVVILVHGLIDGHRRARGRARWIWTPPQDTGGERSDHDSPAR